MGLKLVLWDFDGTLANTAGDVWSSLQYAAHRIGGSIPDAVAEQDSNLALPISKLFLFVNPVPAPELEPAFESDVAFHYRNLCNFEHTAFYPGIENLLRVLRRYGVRQEIVTNKPTVALERILDNKGWRCLFDGWQSADDGMTEHLRRKSDLMREVLERTHTDMDRCVTVGDSATDAIAAHKLGLSCIGVTYGDGDTASLLEAHPTLVAHDTKELERIILERV